MTLREFLSGTNPDKNMDYVNAMQRQYRKSIMDEPGLVDETVDLLSALPVGRAAQEVLRQTWRSKKRRGGSHDAGCAAKGTIEQDVQRGAVYDRRFASFYGRMVI